MRITFVFLLLSFGVFAQQPVMWHISTDDGLETEIIYDLAFDKEGRAWMGTFGGLMSYEGIEVSSHYSRDVRTRTCTNLQFDENGDILFTNFANGIYRYNAFEDSSYLLKGNPLEDRTEFGDYYLYADNEIWFLGPSTVYHGFVKNDSCYLKDTLKNIHSISKILADENGVPWLICNHSDRTNGIIINLENLERTNIPAIPPGYSARAVRKGVIWYSHGDGINIYQQNFKTKEERPLLKNKVNMVRLSSLSFINDQVWIGSSNGLFIADLDGNLVEGFSQPLFEGSTISKVRKDFEGNVWVTTVGDGIWIMPNIKIIDLTKSNPVFSNPVMHALSYGEKEWIVSTSDNVVYQLDAQLKSKQVFHTKQLEEISSLLIDKDSNLLVGGYHGLEAFRLNENALQPYVDIEKIPVGIRRLAKGPSNTILIANWNSSFVYYPGGHKEELQLDRKLRGGHLWTEALKSIGPITVRLSFYDSVYQNIWQETFEGATVYSPGEEALGMLTHENGEKVICAISDFVQGDDGDLWISTNGGGLLKIRDRQLVRRFGKKQGLRHMVILDMERYKNELWLATYEGLQVFDMNTETFESFNEFQGIKELPYNTIAVNENYVMTGHTKASFLFRKDNVNRPVEAPPIYLKKVKINGRDTLVNNHYELSHQQENIQILFSTVHYSSAKSYDFEYRIFEQGEQWKTIAGESGRVDLNGLRPGTHTFQVRTINSTGVRSDHYKEIQFVLHPAFWKTIPFQMGIVLLFGLVIGMIAWVRIKTLKRQSLLAEHNARVESEKQQLEAKFKQAQLSALKAQLNPHFIFNALNSIQEFILLNERVQANRFLGKFADLMRLTLENSTQKTISLRDEIKLLHLYLQLEGLRFEDHFSYEISGESALELDGVEIPAMLIQPYVENALKHGLLHKKSDRKLTVDFALAQDQLLVSIEDNGIGRANSEKINAMRDSNHKSFAMGANAKRLDLLNTGKQNNIAVQIIDLYSSTNEPMGTRVQLSIPIE